MRTALDADMVLSAADFGSVQAAYAYVRDELDLAGHTVQINTLDAAGVVLEGQPTGYGRVLIRGAGGYPGQTTCNFYLCEGAQAVFDNMTLASDGDGLAVSRGVAWLKEVWVGQCLVGLHACGAQSLIRGVGAVTTLHATRSKIQFNSENEANIELPCELRISGGPSWEVYLQADGGSVVDVTGATITKASERGRSAAWYDCGFVRLGPGMTWSSLPGNGETDSDR